MTRIVQASAFGLLVALVLQVSAEAAESHITVIQVKNMHCGNCAKKISRKLYTVKGVLKVTCNVKQNKVWVHSQASVKASPRAMWEAVEAAEQVMVKLNGLHGVFTEKPDW